MNDKILINGMNMVEIMAEIKTSYPFIRCREKSGTVQVQMPAATMPAATEEDDERITRRAYWETHWDNSRNGVEVKEGCCYPLGSIVRMNGEGKMSARCVFEFGDNASLVASEGAEFAITGSGGPKLTLVILKGCVDLKLPLELKEGLFRVETPFCSCENLSGESRFKYCLVDHSAVRLFGNDEDDDIGRHDNIIVQCVTGSMTLSCGHFKFPRLVPANQMRITRVPGPRDEFVRSRYTFVTSIKGEVGDCRALLDTENLFKYDIKTKEMLEKAKEFDFLLSPQCVIKESGSFKTGCRTHLSIMTINANGEKKSHFDLNFPEPKF